jgi:hypothetical protein
MGTVTTFGQANETLRGEHFKRYVEFLRTTVSLAFGGFMFLLAFEKDFVTAQSHGRCLVQLAWFLLLASALSGLYSQFAWVIAPARRLSAAYKQLQGHPELPESITIPAAVPPAEKWLYAIHLSSFVLSLLLLCAYKALNL